MVTPTMMVPLLGCSDDSGTFFRTSCMAMHSSGAANGGPAEHLKYPHLSRSALGRVKNTAKKVKFLPNSLASRSHHEHPGTKQGTSGTSAVKTTARWEDNPTASETEKCCNIAKIIRGSVTKTTWDMRLALSDRPQPSATINTAIETYSWKKDKNLIILGGALRSIVCLTAAELRWCSNMQKARSALLLRLSATKS